MAWAVPTIWGVQRMTVILLAAVALVLLSFISSAAALGCLVGGAVVIANLFALTLIGRWILTAASGRGGISRLGVVAAPLKLLIIVAVIYLVCTHTRIDIPGFALGVSTQLSAVFIETWRVSSRAA